MKYTRKKYIKKNKKTRKNVIMLKGGAWYSFFLPLFGYKSETDTKAVDSKVIDKPDVKKDIETSNTKEDNLRNPEKVEKPVIKKNVDKKGKDKVKGNKPVKTAKELYKTDIDDARIEKEFYPNPNITTWCFNEPNYKPVGIVHVTSVVGINILRSYATIARNVVGVKGTIDENMHQLRNEIYTEMENVMDKKNIDKICSVGVAFTKDSGSLILSAFGTALRRIAGNE